MIINTVFKIFLAITSLIDFSGFNTRIQLFEIINNSVTISNTHKENLNQLVEGNVRFSSGSTYVIQNGDDYYRRWNIETEQDIEIWVVVKDNSNNSQEFSIWIRIQDDYCPEFYGKFSYQVQSNKLLTIEEIYSNLTCIDNSIGEIDSKHWKVISDNYTSNYNKAGLYEIVIYATDGRNYNELSVEIEVTDGLKPVISGSSGFIVNDFDNLFTLKEIKSFFTAYDETDGILTNRLVFDTNYPEDLSKVLVQDYYLNISVSDKASNKTTVSITISVIDITSPDFYLEDFIVSNANPLIISEIVKYLKCIDNADGYISSDDYVIKETNYNPKEVMVKEYYIDVLASDKSGNEQSFKLVFNVVDRLAPKISINSKIIFSSAKKYTDEEIKTLVKAYDETDGDISLNISVDTTEYKKSFNRVGEYLCVARVSDSANNSSEFTFNIEVIDNDYPVIYVNNMITISDQVSLSRDKLIEILKKASGLVFSNDAVTEIETNYFENQYIEGNYDVKLYITDKSISDSVIVVERVINVVSTNIKNEEQVKTKKVKWYSKILNFFKKIINIIRSWVDNLINK